MSNKQIKIWLAVSALILTIVGMSASYAAKPLYKGLEKSDELQASSLTLDIPKPEETDFSDVIKENSQERQRIAPAAAGAEAASETTAPKEVKSTTPCFDKEMPLIKNGQIIGCRAPDSVIPAPNVILNSVQDLPPAPTVKIIR
ncbi:hypothetical protein HZA42_01820 [Candidatus Peregrinibacteria bacterium]|nr:hypothetical protein [Candidatus Peregrinibacteria bacterium]